MNQVIDLIKNHRSIRAYKDTPINDEVLGAVLDAAHSMPSSINGQQVSVIVVKDTETKKKLAEIAGGQVWIDQAPVFLVFVADFYKTSLAGEKIGQTQVIHESAEGLVVGLFDSGLAMGAAIIAAESLGLGIVPIGGIRRDPQGVIDLLELPEFTFPVAGLVLGYPSDLSSQKPRLSKESFVHLEKYQIAGLKAAVDHYDDVMADYYEKGNRSQNVNWSHQTGHTYNKVYFPLVHPVLKKQGFIQE